MAKQQISNFVSWEDINTAMKELGKLNVTVQAFEGEQTLRINEVKAYYKEKSAGYLSKIKEIEKNIRNFANQNKSEFVKTRNKKLTNGAISYRRTKKVVCSFPESAIQTLKELNMESCIRVKEELDKDKILKCDPKLLIKAGIQILEEDKIKIEPDYVKINGEEGTEDAGH